MKRIRVTQRMAERILAWLEREGLIEYDDTLTVEDLMKPEPVLHLVKEDGK